MPTRLQVAVYEYGIRFSQTRVLSGINPHRRPDLQAATVRLLRSFVDLMKEAQISVDRYELGRNLLNDSLAICQQLPTDTSESSAYLISRFRELLTLFEQDTARTLASIDTSDNMLRDWLQLAVEVTDGYREMRLNSSFTNILSDPPWSIKNPDLVEKLLKRLNVDSITIIPAADTSMDGLFPSLYPYLVPAWSKAETGLQRLKARAVGADLTRSGEAEFITLPQMAALVQKELIDNSKWRPPHTKPFRPPYHAVTVLPQSMVVERFGDL